MIKTNKCFAGCRTLRLLRRMIISSHIPQRSDFCQEKTLSASRETNSPYLHFHTFHSNFIHNCHYFITVLIALLSKWKIELQSSWFLWMSFGIYLTRTHSWWRSCCLSANKTVFDSVWYASINKSVMDCYLWNLQIIFYSVKPSLLIIVHHQCLFTVCCNTCTEKFFSSLKLSALCNRLGVPNSAQLILYIDLL